MNCFYHPQTPAIGLCKNCSRGICPECAVDSGFGLACKDRCEADVKALGQLIERNKRVSLRTGAVYLRVAVLYGLMGLFFLGFPYFFQRNAWGDLRYLFLGFAMLFLLGAVFNLVNAKKMKMLESQISKSNKG